MAERKTRKITDADLARVGPGTAGGEWLRRYWLAVSRVEEADKVIEFGCFTGVKPKSNGAM